MQNVGSMQQQPVFLITAVAVMQIFMSKTPKQIVHVMKRFKKNVSFILACFQSVTPIQLLRALVTTVVVVLKIIFSTGRKWTVNQASVRYLRHHSSSRSSQQIISRRTRGDYQ